MSDPHPEQPGDDLERGDAFEIIARLGGVADAIDSVATEMRRTREAAEQSRDVQVQAGRRTRMLAWAGGFIAVGMILFGALGVTNRQVIHSIEDCTQPEGDCYQANQKRSASIVNPVLERLDRIDQRSARNYALLCAQAPAPKPEGCPAE